MDVKDFDFDLPSEYISFYPNKKREEAKLLVVNKKENKIFHKKFYDIVSYFKEGDVLVLNDTKVINARLFGIRIKLNEQKKLRIPAKIRDLKTSYIKSKSKSRFVLELLQNNLVTFSKVEIMLIKKERTSNNWEFLAKPKKRIKENDLIIFFKKNKGVDKINESNFLSNTEFFSKNLDFQKYGIIKTNKKINDLEIELNFNLDEIKKIGSIPLPPYIKRMPLSSDEKMYQTVFSKNLGSVASPTASLHFTKSLLKKLEEKGVIFVYITLNIGLGTFMGVKEKKIKDHKMHEEEYFVSKKSADVINKAIKENRRIIASGTTSLRVLETLCFKDKNKYLIKSGKGSTDIFIYPPYKFKIVDSLITNFHTPKSTLIMLISAFYDREKILEIYKEAIKKNYKFFSYGDAMFLTDKTN